MVKNIGVIILAAGASVRMGRPKQILSFKKKTLLQRIVNNAAELDCGPVVIVLGANAELLEEKWGNAIVVNNENWQEGMAGSICCGLKKLMEKFPSIDGAILAVCDQPYVTVSLLQKMLDMHQQSHLPIIACSYGNTVGTPVFFHRSIFPELLQLQGDKGAKQIILRNMERVGLVDFPAGTTDVDTEEDYTRLIQNDKNDIG